VIFFVYVPQIYNNIHHFVH